MYEYQDYGMTPEQLHAGIDRLWKALGVEGVQADDCFTMAAAEIERLRAGVAQWSYCASQGMKSECPEKVEELADFLMSCGVAPYYMPLR